MANYSFSRLDLFERCPRWYYYRYRENIPEPPSYEADFGKLVHSVIAQHLKDRSVKLEEAANQLVLASPLLGEKDAKETVKLARGFVTGYFPPEDGAIYVEHKLNATLSSGAHLIGRADLIEAANDEITITDFKTGRTTYKPLDTKQLPLYAWLVSKQFRTGSVTGRLVWLRSSKERFLEEIITKTAQEEAAMWAEATISKIEQASQLPGWAGFSEKPGSWCSSCPHTVKCLTLAVPNDPTEIGALVLRLEAITTDLKEKLKAYVEANGPISVGDEVFDFHPRSSWDWDIMGLKALLSEIGLDPYKYFNADARKLKRFLDDDNKYSHLFRQVGKENVTKYFTHKKAQ